MEGHGYWKFFEFARCPVECAGRQFCLRIMSVVLLTRKRYVYLQYVLKNWANDVHWNEEYKSFFFTCNGSKSAAELHWLCSYYMQCGFYDMELLYHVPGEKGMKNMVCKYTLFTVADVGR